MSFVNLSSERKARREADLAAMRERFQRNPRRSQARYIRVSERIREVRVIKPKVLKPRDLAHAIRIAARIASERRTPNPIFIEALEIAASYFDDLG